MVPTLERSWTSSGLAYYRRSPRHAKARVVLLHGVGLRLESWLPQIEAMSQDFEVFAFDLPGHGASQRLANEEPSLSAYAEVLITGINTMSAQPVYLAGHSLGALITLEIAARWPDRLLGVMALSSIYRRSEDARRSVMARAEALWSAAAAGQTADPEPTLARWFSSAKAPDLARWAQACRIWLTQEDEMGSARGYAQAYQTFAQQVGPSPQDVERLAMPCLFATGALDPNSTPAMSQALAKTAPQGRALIIEGAAHMAQLTHGEALNQAVIDHLKTIIQNRRTDLGAGLCA